jgi:hypothetical protein
MKVPFYHYLCLRLPGNRGYLCNDVETESVFFFLKKKRNFDNFFVFFFFWASGSWKLEGIDLLGKKNLYRPRRDHDQDWTRPKECRPIMMPATVWSEPYHQSMTSSSQSISLNGLLLSHVPLIFLFTHTHTKENKKYFSWNINLPLFRCSGQTTFPFLFLFFLYQQPCIESETAGPPPVYTKRLQAKT